MTYTRIPLDKAGVERIPNYNVGVFCCRNIGSTWQSYLMKDIAFYFIVYQNKSNIYDVYVNVKYVKWDSLTEVFDEHPREILPLDAKLVSEFISSVPQFQSPHWNISEKDGTCSICGIDPACNYKRISVGLLSFTWACKYIGAIGKNLKAALNYESANTYDKAHRVLELLSKVYDFTDKIYNEDAVKKYYLDQIAEAKRMVDEYTLELNVASDRYNRNYEILSSYGVKISSLDELCDNTN